MWRWLIATDDFSRIYWDNIKHKLYFKGVNISYKVCESLFIHVYVEQYHPGIAAHTKVEKDYSFKIPLIEPGTKDRKLAPSF